MKSRVLMLAAALSLSLAACSAEPSQSDIEGALTNLVETSNRQGMAMMGDSKMARDMFDKIKMTVSDVKKLGCQESGKNAYSCDVSLKFSGGFGSGAEQALPLKFVKADSGWVISGASLR